MLGELVVNRWITPDGTVLQSKHVHDYVTYSDADGNFYYIDGGLHYCRISGNMKSLCLHYGDEHSEIRKYFSWKSYGKDGKQHGTWLKLQDMGTDHIEAILDTQKHIFGTVVELVFKDELKYREDYVSASTT